MGLDTRRAEKNAFRKSLASLFRCDLYNWSGGFIYDRFY